MTLGAIAAAPKEARAKLVQLRKIVKAAAPKADEGISYKMPYYKYHGALVGFAAFKNHIGFFAVPVEEHKQELKGYETGKGSVRFPIDRPLPVALIKKLVKSRIKGMRQKGDRKNLPPKKNLKSSFPLRFLPSLKSFGRVGEAGGNSVRRAQSVRFGYLQTDTSTFSPTFRGHPNMASFHFSQNFRLPRRDPDLPKFET
jgi:uncharacterized protein YdhG (YjbR/CyaY superfamily)